MFTLVSFCTCSYVYYYIIKQCICTFVALQNHQGQTILNGRFIVHRSLSFTAIGNEFQYVRNLTEEYVVTPGPLQQELTVQVNLT